jgi:L-fuculose-phosphate aldolase
LENPNFSREGKAHLAIYRAFPDVQGIIHAHAFHIQPFAAASRPIEPVLEATQKFGVINLVDYAPSHTDELAKNIVSGFLGKEEQIRKQAAAVLIPTHGIFVAGKDLLSALDALERIDWNAWCILARGLLP